MAVRMVGGMCKGSAIHLAVPAKIVESNGKPYQLYRPACKRVTFRNVTWLMQTTGDGVAPTCKNCLAKVNDGDTFVAIKHGQ